LLREAVVFLLVAIVNSLVAEREWDAPAPEKGRSGGKPPAL
jgi:hypothetical protein